MSILVLGGAGYIGSHTVYELIDRGEDVVVVDNLQTGFKAAVHPKARFYEGDIRDKAFLDDLFTKEKIDGVLSLIDPELSLLAKNEKLFEAIGTKVIGSAYDLCEMSLDKYQMYLWLKEHQYKCAKSYMDKMKFYKDVENGKIKED